MFVFRPSFGYWKKAPTAVTTRVPKQGKAGQINNHPCDLLRSKPLYQRPWSLSCLTLEVGEGHLEPIAYSSLAFISHDTTLHPPSRAHIWSLDSQPELVERGLISYGTCICSTDIHIYLFFICLSGIMARLAVPFFSDKRCKSASQCFIFEICLGLQRPLRQGFRVKHVSTFRLNIWTSILQYLQVPIPDSRPLNLILVGRIKAIPSQGDSNSPSCCNSCSTCTTVVPHREIKI